MSNTQVSVYTTNPKNLKDTGAWNMVDPHAEFTDRGTVSLPKVRTIVGGSDEETAQLYRDVYGSDLQAIARNGGDNRIIAAGFLEALGLEVETESYITSAGAEVETGPSITAAQDGKLQHAFAGWQNKGLADHCLTYAQEAALAAVGVEASVIGKHSTRAQLRYGDKTTQLKRGLPEARVLREIHTLVNGRH